MYDLSYRNDMHINPHKTKEMVVCFCKEDDHHADIQPLVIDGTIIERVPHAKVLGVTTCILANLCWNVHIENISSKASKRMYMLYQVKKGWLGTQRSSENLPIGHPTSVGICLPSMAPTPT